MIDLLKKLCLLDAPSGNEKAVTDFIIDEIKDYCDYYTDNLGNIIVTKKGKKKSKNKLLVDCHTDEVGLIISSITDDGFLRFKPMGINTSALLCKRVTIEGKIKGVIGCKSVHLCSSDERQNIPSVDSLYIDIGAKNREEAERMAKIGDTATFCSDFVSLGENCIKAKALDDRIGCAILINLLKKEAEYDYFVSFSVQEELGLRGAKVAAYTVEPQFALCLEATTAADLEGIKNEDKICCLGMGPALSFMDNATYYDRELYNCALNSGIKCQTKAGVTGGNNAGAIHLSKSSVRTLAISAPCRYIHSPSCVSHIEDIKNMELLTEYMINKICSGDIK